MGSEPIHVGGDKQLFIDHRFIESIRAGDNCA